MKYIPSTPRTYSPCKAISFCYLHGSMAEKRLALHILTREEEEITNSITTWNTQMAGEMSLSSSNYLDMQAYRSLTPLTATLQILAARSLLIRFSVVQVNYLYQTSIASVLTSSESFNVSTLWYFCVVWLACFSIPACRFTCKEHWYRLLHSYQSFCGAFPTPPL